MVALRHARVLIAAVLVPLLLSACGNRFVSPAAVVDGHRITQDALKQETLIFELDPNLAKQFAGETAQKDLARRVLLFMIVAQLLQPYAQRHAVSVAASDVDPQVQQVTNQYGGAAALQKRLATDHLTLAEFRANVTRSELITKVQAQVVMARLGNTQASAQQQGQVFSAFVIQQLRAATVEVNPRFGRLDPSTISIDPIVSTQG